MATSYVVSNAVSDPFIVPQTNPTAPYKVPSVRDPPPLPSLRTATTREYRYKWMDQNILRYRLMMEEEPTEKYSEDQVQAIRDRATEYKRRLDIILTVPESDYWRRQDAYDGFSFARYILLWRIFPINDLPSEILTHIFRFVALSVQSSADALLIRLHLTWVCRHWRAIAIADPILWSSIHFRLKKDDTLIPPSIAMQRSLAFLERASNTTLDILISAIPQDWGMPMHSHKSGLIDPKVVDRVLKRIASKVSQLRTLTTNLENPVCDYALKVLYDAITEGTIPTRLRHFELRRTQTRNNADPPKSAHEPPLPFLGSQLPALSNLILDGISVDWAQSSFGNVTALELSSTHCRDLPLYDTELIRILKACPNVEDLKLGPGRNPLQIQGHEIEPITLHKLQSFALYESSPTNSMRIASLINAPHVESLIILSMGPNDCTPLYSMLTGRYPELRSLVLEGTRHLDEDSTTHVLAGWFLSMPELRFLSVKDVSHDNRVYDGILSNPSVGLSSNLITLGKDDPESDSRAWEAHQHICPKLEILECRNIESSGHVLEFAATRKEVGVPLKKIYISEGFLRDLERDELQDFQDVTDLWVLPRNMFAPELIKMQQSKSGHDTSIVWI
ncbi:hypothetical protein NEOLEDRAFT_1126435 [Neolentinus lepideus HHB14362 ss-1]|uniref:F-box domain-containing protein n=1 Tax=Neolentinus lepideus HHB14362 ss-1 TaxID=1314782 RepID=A0A165W7Y6_9AGAM|nr:hypothetical protein NEOLEDRAFT_1126435 [Neolentinus lepideus HHB14362 ss-1]